MPESLSQSSTLEINNISIEVEQKHYTSHLLSIQKNALPLINPYALTRFEQISQTNATTLFDEIDKDLAPFSKIAIVHPSIFSKIHKTPSWVGAYLWWDGNVIYRLDYINTVLSGNGEFGGEQFTIAYFEEENKHELLHSAHQAAFLQNQEDILKHLATTSLWYIEGLVEAATRKKSKMTEMQLVHKLNIALTQFPEFSIQTLTDSFWQYCQLPTGKNFAYQYCRYFVSHLAKIVNQQLYPNQSALPFKGAHSILSTATKKYNQGCRKNIFAAIEQKTKLNKQDVLNIETNWRQEFLNPQNRF